MPGPRQESRVNDNASHLPTLCLEGVDGCCGADPGPLSDVSRPMYALPV